MPSQQVRTMQLMCTHVSKSPCQNPEHPSQGSCMFTHTSKKLCACRSNRTVTYRCFNIPAKGRAKRDGDLQIPKPAAPKSRRSSALITATRPECATTQTMLLLDKLMRGVT
eukprot:scaffold62697_cov19-Tisochrysis_lutea.AAC.3